MTIFSPLRAAGYNPNTDNWRRLADGESTVTLTTNEFNALLDEIDVARVEIDVAAYKAFSAAKKLYDN